jgi:hypothetical protein
MHATNTKLSVKPVVRAFPRLLQDLLNAFFIAISAAQNAKAIVACASNG